MATRNRFIWNDADMQISQCVRCAHKDEDATCAAFQSEIPKRILLNEHDHRKPYPGDNGIRFLAVQGNE